MLQKFIKRRFFLILILLANEAVGQINLSGYFIARSECPALQSIKKQTNPGNVRTETDRAYDLIAKNKEDGSHYLVKMAATPNQRWVEMKCGEHVVPFSDASSGGETGSSTTTSGGSGSSSSVGQNQDYVLAISWQPGFCETKPTKPECVSQNGQRFDADHFSLHGLWPQPIGNFYCNVAQNTVNFDKNRQWDRLPDPQLTINTSNELNQVMPGTQSDLHRHEWVKHGTCYGTPAETYFKDSVKLIQELNASVVRELFFDNIGKEISKDQIQAAFDSAFGDGAGERIDLSCSNDGRRRLITEIKVNLSGTPDNLSLGRSITAAPKTTSDCQRGIVDPVGFQ